MDIVTAAPTGPPAPARPAASIHRPPEPAGPVDDAFSAAALDRLFHAAQGQLTLGASPLALWLASADWAAHAANAPFRASELGREAVRAGRQFWGAVMGGRQTEPDPYDHRFAHPGWSAQPFAAWREAFLLSEGWVDRALLGAPGVNAANERLLSFAGRQWMDAWSPSNCPWINPEVLEATREQGGANLVRGYANYVSDAMGRTAEFQPKSDEGLKVGRDLAVTPGLVVARNDLFELIQYLPTTEVVHPEPVLITPAWIMKYYILDLSPANSLVRFLVSQGYTVYCMSWRNPDATMRDIGFADYRRNGLMAALEAIGAIQPGAKIHACGYCLGGTLLSMSAAAMARDGDARLASLTLLSAQTDFSEAGELQLFTTEDQIEFLEDVMSAQGYLDGRQMGGAFQLLRSRDLIWSRLVTAYCLGLKHHPNDLMVWNEDATRLPSRMHSEYVRELYLGNNLSEGRFQVDGRPISIGDIRAPLFVVGTETDHVAPWRSVFMIELLNNGEITFALTTGGHNAGIVSEPGHPRRSFRLGRRPAGGRYIGPDEWLAQTPSRVGSWWSAWLDWLDERSGPQTSPPPPVGAPARGYPPLDSAPGLYVFDR